MGKISADVHPSRMTARWMISQYDVSELFAHVYITLKLTIKKVKILYHFVRSRMHEIHAA